MSWIIICLLGFAALLLVLSLFKKLIKLAFTAISLLLLVAGIWYFWLQNPPEIPASVPQAGEEAAETIQQVAGQVLDEAAEVVKDGAAQAMDKAGEAIQEGAGEAMHKAGEAIQEGAEQARNKAGELAEDLSGEGEPDQDP